MYTIVKLSEFPARQGTMISVTIFCLAGKCPFVFWLFMQQDETAEFCARLASLPAADGIMVLYPAWRIVISLPSPTVAGGIQMLKSSVKWWTLISLKNRQMCKAFSITDVSSNLRMSLKEYRMIPQILMKSREIARLRSFVQLLTKRPPLRWNVRFRAN